MKILLVVNKTYRNKPDSAFWYLFLPLKKLGHEIYWYDTVSPDNPDFDKIIDSFKPDLIFCCLTGDRNITPFEPWEQIQAQTQKGNIKTFNWFCDDTWRFNNFSSKVCDLFTVCSTPEPSFINKFKEIGYDNIILGCWHANCDFYPRLDFQDKDIPLSFIGFPTKSRQRFFETCDLPIKNLYGLNQEELFHTHSKSKIGINLSVNDNDPEKKTQMKQRMFEIPAGQGLLVTEHHDGIEHFFEIDKEVVTFKCTEELEKKVKFLLKKPKILKTLALNGHRRFTNEHDSTKRLEKVLKDIQRV